MKYIGFIVDGKVPTVRNALSSRNPLPFINGWPSNTAVALMRYSWIAEIINCNVCDFCYELYRPWRRYTGVIFLKSMGSDSIQLMKQLKRSGVKTIFDANVDYFSPAAGTFYYQGMAPTNQQRQAAIEMAKGCDGVIGDSEYIAEIAGQYSRNVVTIEDNVKNSFIAGHTSWTPDMDAKMELLWSGQAVKLFELLAIKEVLLAFKDQIRLKMVTNSLQAIKLWAPEYKKEFEGLLAQVPHEFVEFTDIVQLMKIFDFGGVFISPRFLNNTYNFGHTEWKITLPMARGRVVICSPQRSYKRVRGLAKGIGIRVCVDTQDWFNAFSECRSSNFAWHREQSGAIAVVNQYYRTSEIAEKHLEFVKKVTC